MPEEDMVELQTIAEPETVGESLPDLQQIQDLVQDLAGVAPLEVLPVDPLPVHAVTWFARLLLFFARHAYLLAFVGALLENTIVLGFLLPGGAVVALSAAGARQAQLSLPTLVLLAAAGMTGGAVIDYFLGRAGIARLLHHRWAGRLGRRLATQLEQAEPLLRRHGWWVMLLAHAFGHGRSSLALAAGASGLPLARFLAIEIPAALLWSAVYAGGGFLLAAEWETFELVLRRAGWAVTAATVCGVVAWWYLHRRRRQSRGGQPFGANGTAGHGAGHGAGPLAAPVGAESPVVTELPDRVKRLDNIGRFV
ncbi:MAG TPA: DedA family protein [Chloroflexota bacterium]|nr:DedA family protein [Chloroflexota bacterium]